MKNDGDNLYVTDYVYVPTGTELFKSVRILLQMPEDKLELYISSDEKVHKEDLSIILVSLQKNQFDKIRIDLAKDVTIFVTMDNEKYFINFEDSDLKKLSLSVY